MAKDARAKTGTNTMGERGNESQSVKGRLSNAEVFKIDRCIYKTMNIAVLKLASIM